MLTQRTFSELLNCSEVLYDNNCLHDQGSSSEANSLSCLLLWDLADYYPFHDSQPLVSCPEPDESSSHPSHKFPLITILIFSCRRQFLSSYVFPTGVRQFFCSWSFIFSNITLYIVTLKFNWRFGGTWALLGLFFDPQDGDDMFLRNHRCEKLRYHRTSRMSVHR
jgi:hypothetical protein